MSTLSKNQNKLIRSLARKKDRKETGLFLVEGDKMVREVLAAPSGGIPYKPEWVVSTPDWLAESGGNLPRGMVHYEVGAAELKRLSTLQEPKGALAVVRQAEYEPDLDLARAEVCIGLENIQDPGNLGTIIRTADWFGIRDIFCSPGSVELYNPKVIQSTMGSFLRIRVHYMDLKELIARMREPGSSQSGATATGYYPVFATGGNGTSLYETDLPDRGMILLGNESKGLSDALLEKADRLISIPSRDPGIHPESLNIASAAAILCAEFRRQGKIIRSKSRA